MIKVSIVVPIYNTEKYLDKCLSSLAKQTLKEIEIICINDGSTDNSQKIVDDYTSKYPKIFKSFVKVNGGLGSARNYGIEVASGEYIAFLDSDDYVKESIYEDLYKNAIKNNSDIVNCGFIRIDEKGKILSKEQHNLDLNYSSQEAILNLAPAAWNKLYKRRIFIDNNIRYPENIWYEDLPTTIKLILHSKKITTIPNTYIYYLQRQSSIIYTYDSRARDIFKVLSSTQEYLKLNSIENYDSIEAIFIIHIIFAHLFRSTALPVKDLMKEIKYSKEFMKKYYIKYYKNKKIYENLSSIKKICVFIGIKCFQYNIYIFLLMTYKFINKLIPVQQKW